MMLIKLRRFLVSGYYLPIPLLIGLFGLFGNEQTKIISMIVNVFLLTAVLFISDDLLPALSPAFCTIIIGATLLETLEIVIPYIPFAYPVVVATVFHVIRYRNPIRIGLSFPGLVITAVAVLISGIGTDISTRDYASLGAIYHLIGLSVGLIVLYFFFATNRRADRGFDPIHYFLMSLTVLGLLCAATIMDPFFDWLIPNITAAAEGNGWSPKDYFPAIFYRNTISTLGVMCIPSAFYLAKNAKHTLSHVGFLLLGLVIYLGAVLTLARTAIMFGTMLLVICLVYYLWGRDSWKAKAVSLALLTVCATVTLILLWKPLISLLDFRLPKGWISSTESRAQLLVRSFSDFLAHPIFGIGITSLANTDIYSAEGCICWYHMYFPQLWGSMGLFGIVAYMVQLALRARLVLTKPDKQSIAMGLVYLGLFLYSQTDPGEFAPIPYAVLTVPLFMLLEGRSQVIKQKATEQKTAADP